MIKVYHNIKQYGIESTIESTSKVLKKGPFECVAEVETDSLNEAYKDTNNIESPWHLNTNVKAIRQENRSTSVGDLLKRDNTFFVIDSFGFRGLTREEECSLTFHLEEGSMKKPTKSDIARQLAKELGIPCIDLPLSTDSLNDIVGEALVIDSPTPEEILFLDKMKAKGYTIGVQFNEDGKPFGEPLAFKTPKDLSSFMWENSKLKMTWMRKL